eukprot:scaffold17.g544.t1
MTGPQASLPFSNIRFVLTDELLAASEDDYVAGTVARLYHTPTSHPAVRQSLQGLDFRKLSVPAVAVQHLVNNRGPDGLVGVIPGESKHSAKLLDLCQRCHDNGEVLVCSIPAADMVLVPRQPATSARDGLYFLAFATNVALVLDLDNTLVDATACSIAAEDWDLLAWRPLTVHTSGGRAVAAQHAPLPGDDPHAAPGDGHVMHWKVGRVSCTFRVRVRPGWADLRAFLAAQAHKFAVFVCSKGKSEYIQILWEILDPWGELIPRADWPARLTSTFPDTLTQYCPSDLLYADSGNVLHQAAARLHAYWEATCTSSGTFAWQAAQSFAMALMGAMQRNPMESPDALARCRKQGEALAHQFTVRSVFGPGGALIEDAPGSAEAAAARALLAATLPPAAGGGAGGLAAAAAAAGCVAMEEEVEEPASPDGRSSVDSVALMGSSVETLGGAGGGAPPGALARAASDGASVDLAAALVGAA